MANRNGFLEVKGVTIKLNAYSISQYAIPINYFTFPIIYLSFSLPVPKKLTDILATFD